MENEWIDNEIKDLQLERKCSWKKRRDNVIFFKLMIFLLPLLIYSVCLQGIEPKSLFTKFHKHKNLYISDGKKTGINWVCKYCGARHWTDSRARDWNGDIYCTKCKRKR